MYLCNYNAQANYKFPTPFPFRLKKHGQASVERDAVKAAVDGLETIAI